MKKQEQPAIEPEEKQEQPDQPFDEASAYQEEISLVDLWAAQ